MNKCELANTRYMYSCEYCYGYPASASRSTRSCEREAGSPTAGAVSDITLLLSTSLLVESDWVW